MYMAEGLDTGDMILKRETPLGPDETSGELYGRLAGLGAQALSETVRLIGEGCAPRVPQDGALATHAPMLTKELARHRLDEAGGRSPQPDPRYEPLACRTYVARRAAAQGLPLAACARRYGAPGTLAKSGGFVVACGQGAVELLEIQEAGKKRMAAADYLRGHPDAAGKTLG